MNKIAYNDGVSIVFDWWLQTLALQIMRQSYVIFNGNIYAVYLLSHITGIFSDVWWFDLAYCQPFIFLLFAKQFVYEGVSFMNEEEERILINHLNRPSTAYSDDRYLFLSAFSKPVGDYRRRL
jgi:hypothetical protein